jgi:hypothetical protein
VRGNAYLILLVAAEEAKYIWDDGHEHFRTLDDRLLTFRAGPWRDWWSNDIRWEAEMLGCSAAVVLWENNRILTTVELSGFNGLLDLTPPRVGDPPRLPKDTARAGQCWYCPVREKCDGWDELHGETGDWPDKWGK